MSAVRVGLVDWRLPVSGPLAVMLAAQLGVDGIQLDLGGPRRAPWLDEPKRLHELQLTLAGSGLVPLAISANVLNDLGLTAKEGTSLANDVRNVIIRALNVAAELGVDLVFLPSFRRSAITDPPTLTRTAEILRWACDEASQRKILLATENVLAPKQLRTLMALVDSSNFRVVLDTGNISNLGADPVAILRTAGAALARQVHIKNTNDQQPLRAPPPAVLNTLAELRQSSVPINAMILENDYRNGELNRITADIGWLRDQLAAQSNNSMAASQNKIEASVQ
ncbi:sugar phosphate isomerase/epimerase family protein [Agrobacterium vitis]|uniref:sugar phosphate isomerase/epimerase family protein n=1 Tax=Agrobacterium vitis TaxID=373 RepID=UPI002035B1BE|nr:sugar phosphate isomerase/epimerase family protein [Agrobacterium vitis]MCM2453550.1 sugar phosphate isomerase/epimerase [Agrobacterium vitis]